MEQIPGGYSEEKKATAEIQQLVDSVRKEAEDKAGQKFEKFKATLFREQIVAGSNYCVKVDVGGNKFVHLQIFHPLPCDGGGVQFNGIQLNHTADDKIVRQAAKDKGGQKFGKFVAISFRTQVINGEIYIVKVDVGGGKFAHLRIYQPLPYTMREPAQLTDIQLYNTADDEIKYFG